MAPQIVLVTGSSAGIGLGMVKRLARDPHQRFVIIATVIAMSEKNELEAAVKNDINKTVFIKELDITKDENISEVVASVINNHGRIDILLNIAGLSITSGIPERIKRELIEKTFNVNVIGTIRLTQAVLPHMKEKKSGKIITFSSLLGRIGAPYNEYYVASKFAVEGFFESLAAGLRAFNIRVCLIEPKGVKTALLEGTLNSMRTSAEEESVFEIDRQQLRNATACLAERSSHLTVDEVVDAVITRCVDVDEPKLRHLFAEEFNEAILKTAGDLTGESQLATIGIPMIMPLE